MIEWSPISGEPENDLAVKTCIDPPIKNGKFCAAHRKGREVVLCKAHEPRIEKKKESASS